ncbi:MAG: DUF952 domain-containing protein [Alphaproteobacteria bacterium]
MEAIYTMVRIADWKQAEAAGAYTGSADDTRDGFLHFSTASQIAVSASKHRAGETDLLLVAVDPKNVGDALKWEKSRDDALFPHLYAPLKMKQVSWVKPLPLGEDGLHEFPDMGL